MNIAVLGAQWGDEGKGKIVDLLTPNFSIVARYQGGHNAGHTVYANGRKFVLRLCRPASCTTASPASSATASSSIRRRCSPRSTSSRRPASTIGDRLLVSDKAHLILPYHRELDLLSEARRGERKIGTTSRGIGPAYEDKIARRGVRVGDLANADVAGRGRPHNVAARNRIIAESTMDCRRRCSTSCERAWTRMAPWVTDVSLFLAQRARRPARSIMFEGAQGTLLDIDHGTYPYVTSSNATIGGVCTGLGVPPRAIDGVLGVAKAYTTRVGEGPLPTELTGEMGNRLRESGQEFGAVTGRPRRCGWYDAVAVRYAVRVNGLDALALTKLDVLDGLPELRSARPTAVNGATLTEMPGDSRSSPRASRSTRRCPAGRRRREASGDSTICRDEARPTSRGSKKSPASRPRSSRPARRAKTRSSATTQSPLNGSAAVNGRAVGLSQATLKLRTTNSELRTGQNCSIRGVV